MAGLAEFSHFNLAQLLASTMQFAILPKLTLNKFVDVTVDIKNDRLAEPDVAYFVNLTNPVNAMMGTDPVNQTLDVFEVRVSVDYALPQLVPTADAGPLLDDLLISNGHINIKKRDTKVSRLLVSRLLVSRLLVSRLLLHLG